MKKIVYPVVAFIILVGSAFTIISTQNWKIGDDYSIKFSSQDPSGIFRGLKGTVNFDENNLPESKFDVTVDVTTINTGNGMQNTHAKGAQWFDATKYPEIRFTSSEITKSSSGFLAKGILEIHGVKKEITIPFTFQDNTFTGSFDINRLDFNIGEPGHGATVLKVDLKVPVTKP